MRRRAFDIAGRAIPTLIGAAGVSGVFRIQAAAQRHGIRFSLAHTEDDFTEEETEPFGPNCLRAPFDWGDAKAAAGYPRKLRLPA